MRGTVRTAAAAAVVLVAAGCGTGHGPGTHRLSTLAVAGWAPTTGPPRPPTTGPPTTGPPTTGPPTTGPPVAGSPAPGAAPAGPPVVGTAQAEQMTQALLARAQPPPGAQVLAGRPPGQDLARPPDVQAGSPSAGLLPLLHRLTGMAAQLIPPGK